MKLKRILLLSLIISLFSCQQQKNDKAPPIFTGTETDQGEKAIITGKIINREVYPHVKWLEIKLLDFDGNETTHSSPLTEDGMFRFEIYPITTREISFVPVEDRIVIAPGDSLYIEKDFRNIAHTGFGGTSAELNKHINAFRRKYLGRYSQPYELSFSEFRTETKKQYDETLQKLADFQQQNNTSETFNKWAEKQVALDYYKVLFEFPFYHTERTKEKLTDKERKIYYDFVKEFEKEMDNSMMMASYFETIKGFSRFILEENYPDYFNGKVKAPSKEDMLEKLKSASKNTYLSQFAFAAYVNDEYLRANKSDWIDSNRVKLEESITDPFLRTTLNNRYNQVKAFNANPRVYSDAILGKNSIELQGSGSLITDSANVIKHILDSNSGQVLYVDVWAPWCPGCIIQMPYSKVLHDYFKDKPVTFVYLCIGGEHEHWRKAIEKYELSGIQQFLTNKEAEDLMNRFNIKSIPHYLLFDKNGVMVDFGGHLLPSEHYTKESIEKLLVE
jgi:thiol-disulfide isomerase/thioredoxin